MALETVAIVGAGLGGFQTAASLRESGFGGRVVIVGDEPQRPYQRPPLSKGYLLGATDEARLALRPESFYRDRHVETLLGRRAVAIDRVHRKLALDDDTVIDYAHLVLALGARNRTLPLPGIDLHGVYYLRTLDEARVLREAMTGGARHALVVGAGFIGLEFAAGARKLGIEVTVLDVADRPMARALSREMAAVFTREHARHGVRLRYQTQVMRVIGSAGRVTGVETVEGEVIHADLVLIAVGVVPNTELAAACDLEIGDGIVVDERLLTTDERVSAIGDCAAHPNPYAPGTVRIESVQNATDQARYVAARIAGRPAQFNAVPWFWSDQGELRLQIAGLALGHDRAVMRGDPAGNSCAVFCFRGERLIAVETVNRPADHMAARRLIAQAVPLTEAQARDESVDLKALVPRTPAAQAAPG